MGKMVGTVGTSSPVTVDMPRPTHDNHIQIDVTGSNSVKVETKVKEQDAFVEQATGVSGETIIVDMVNVVQVKLTATGGNVPYAITPYADMT